MKKLSDHKIIDSWNKNIDPWIKAIQEGQITSRVQLTNKAILTAISVLKPRIVLDIGCGEGWLVRAIEKLGIKGVGIDVVPEFITHANEIGEGRFKCMAYNELSGFVIEEKFDALVCNFSLLGKESVEQVFSAATSLLNSGGFFIIQTIHPVTACGKEPYENGWRSGSWTGFDKDFKDPAPWYFRTMDSWKNLFLRNGFSIKEIIEPMNVKTDKPASVIFIGIVSS